MKYFIKEFTEQDLKASDFRECLENYLNDQASQGWTVVSMTVLNNKLTILFNK